MNDKKEPIKISSRAKLTFILALLLFFAGLIFQREMIIVAGMILISIQSALADILEAIHNKN